MNIYSQDPKYCTYLTIYLGSKLPMFYIGSSTIKKINAGYRGSVKSKKYKQIWKQELKDNPHLFKTEIIKEYYSRKMALYREKKLQKQLNVVKSSLYINMSIAAPNGFFGMGGENHPLYHIGHSDITRKNISLNHADISGKNNPRARLIEIITPDNNIIICHGNLKEQCIKLNIPWQTIHQRILAGHIPTSGKCIGYKARYLD